MGCIRMQLRYTPPSALPPLGAPGTGREGLRRPGVVGTYTEPPGGLRLFTRHAPEFIDDPGGTGLFAGFGAATYTSPPALVSAMDDAMLFGYRAVAWGDRFCTDQPGDDAAGNAAFLDKLASSDPFLNEDTGLRRPGAGEVFTLDTEGRPRRHVAGAVVSLCSHEPSNYGSFLFRVLSKMQAVAALDLQDLPVVAWTYNPAFQQLLHLCGVAPERLVRHDTHMLTTVDRVIVPSLRNPHGFLDPESHALFQRLAAQQPRTTGRRLYVSRMGQARRGSSTRLLVNEAELAAALALVGFEVIEPEALPPARQIAAFASADIVVGPAGSAMFNVVFCRPGTMVIDIESEPNWIYAHAGLFASCQLRYGLFVGQVDQLDARPVHRRWTADVPAVLRRLSELGVA